MDITERKRPEKRCAKAKSGSVRWWTPPPKSCGPRTPNGDVLDDSTFLARLHRADLRRMEGAGLVGQTLNLVRDKKNLERYRIRPHVLLEGRFFRPDVVKILGPFQPVRRAPRAVPSKCEKLGVLPVGGLGIVSE
jgi:hypothetical protein